MKNLKQILIVPISLIVLVGAFFFFQSFAVKDNGEDDKEIKIKMIKVVNGVETVVDTTIVIPEGGDIQEILNGLHIDGVEGECNIDSLLQTISLDIDLDENGEESIVKMCVMVDGEEGSINIDSLLGTLNIDINDEENGQVKIITTTIGDDCNNKSKKMNKMVFISDDGDVVHKDEKVKIIKSEEGIIEVIVDDSGEKTITIKSECSGNDDEEVFVYNIGDGDNSIIVKTMICKLNGEDVDELKDAGVETSLKENSLEVEKLSFFPNPNDGKFNLKFNLENKGNTQVKIFDINGKEVYSETLKNFSGNYNKAIDISTKGKGTYFLNISQGNKVLNKKIMIQ